MKTLLFLFGTLLSLNSWGQAQISISPMKQEIKIFDKPVDYYVEIKNETNKKLPSVKIELLNMAVKLDEGIVDAAKSVAKKDPFRPYKDFVRVSDTQISLEPKELKKIKVTILPQKEIDGSAFASLRIYPKETHATSGIRTVVAFFHNMLIYNPPTEKKILTSKFVSYKNEKVTVQLNNGGNTFLRPTAKVTVIKNGKMIASYDAVNDKNLTEIFVFPGGSTKMFISIPKKILTPGSKLLVALYDKNKKYVNTEQIDIK